MLLRTLLVAAAQSKSADIIRARLEAEALVVQSDAGGDLRRQLASEPWDLIVVDAESFPALSADWVRQARAVDKADVVVIAPPEAGADRAALLEAGALAVLDAGLDDATLGALLTTLADRRRSRALLRLSRFPNGRYRLKDYASASPAMRRLLATARRVAATDSTVFILGETGVGKGLLARSIHNEGPRASQAFVTVNCSALPETLLESELFGHVKGAFTGATRSRRGQFELAHRGTLFLDEVTEIPVHLQVKLLRAIEERVVQPLGSEKEIAVDVRVIAASNREIASEMREKRMRSDLYYRLNVVSLTLPPLRERIEDIPELVQSYVDHACQRFGGNAKGIEPAALRALERYPWPGNIRELRNVMERAALLAPGPEITLQDLPVEVAAALTGPAAAPPAPTAAGHAPLHQADAGAWLDRPWSEVRASILDAAERRYLSGLLERFGGRVGEVASHAGMAPRSLFEKMRHHGLRKEDYRRPPPRSAPAGRAG